MICGNCGSELMLGSECIECSNKKAFSDSPKDKKYDQGKPMVGLMKKDFSKALEAVAVVTTYGVEKYKAPGSWRKVTDAMSRYEDALGRHDLLAFEEPYDEESHLLHVAHRAWNALAVLEMVLEELEVKE